jgi:hypothetical protein
MHTFLIKTVITFFLLFSQAICVAQISSIRFSQQVLENPMKNAGWFDTNIPISEISHYQLPPDSQSVFLFNGYASHIISNPMAWDSLRGRVQPVRVQVVFTMQPFSKRDWKTNYYQLLASRINSLLTIDSMLNSERVQWEIILQTKEKTTPKAKALPHGISIFYTMPAIKRIEALSRVELSVAAANVVDPLNCLKTSSNQEFTQEELTENELKAILYPKSVMSPRLEYYKPSETKTRGEPGCPTFRTRMEKPRGRLFSRLFRR